MRVISDIKGLKIKSDEAGYVMVMAIFVMVIATLIGVSLAVMGINEYSLSSNAKLNDVAYQIAEAGVSRACVAIRDDSTIVGTTGGTANLYNTSGTTPFYASGWQTFGTPGWEGQYSAKIYQSELVPTDPTYKVVVATGKITRSGKTAERNIEARIIAGASSQDYDACFDYLMYNGFYGRPWANEAQNDNGSWPAPDIPIWLGAFTWDGITRYNGRSPKGAIYVRGTFDLQAGGISSATVHGNVAAANDVILNNTFAINIFNAGPGLTIDNLGSDGAVPTPHYTIPGTDPYNQGNVVAGVDGTGNATLDMSLSWLGNVSVNGFIAAPNDFTLSNTWTIGSLKIGGGIVAGGDVSVTRDTVATTGGGLALGSIFSGGDTTLVTQTALGNMLFDRISAGGDCTISTNNGGDLEYDPSAPITPGDINCAGKVTISGTTNDVIVGNIYAGNQNDAAVSITGSSSDIKTNDIEAQGSVGITTNSSSSFTALSSSHIYAGKDSASPANGITVNSPKFTSGDLAAVGSINATIGTATVGSMSSGRAITLTATGTGVISGDITAAVGPIVATFTGTNTVQSMYSGGAINLSISGTSSSIKNLTAVGDINGGASLPATIADMPTAGNVWSGGTVTLLRQGAGSITMGDISACQNAVITGTVKNSSKNGTMTFGRINAEGAVTFKGNSDGTSYTSATYIGGIKAGGNASVTLGTNNSKVTASITSLNPWDKGPGTPNNTYTGYNPATDAVAAGGTWTAAGSSRITLTTVAKQLLTPWKPGVDTPSSPSSPSVPGDPFASGPSAGNPPDTDTWLLNQAPTVNQNVMLKVSGLDGPVQLLQPNWQFFLDAATQDQTTSGVPHVLVDGGNGDSDHTVNGVVTFIWTSTVYSSNETIYQGDPTVSVKIDINWSTKGADFKGTLVTQGNVTITNSLSGGGWNFTSGQELNLVCGRDIYKDISAGGNFHWLAVDYVHYHWWARGNIDFTNSTFDWGTGQVLNGSLVAGNKIKYSPGAGYAWTIDTYNWSRWAIDTNAWLPPFTVLSYREI